MGSFLVSALVAVLSAATGAAAEASTVTALPLPRGFTVAPEAGTPAIAVARDGAVVALTHPIDRNWEPRAVRWLPSRGARFYTMGNVSTAPDHGAANQVGSVTAGGNVAYVTVGESFSGGYSGTSYAVDVWTARGSKPWSGPACIDVGDETDQHAYGADDDGRLAVTIDMTGNGSFLVMSAPTEHAPYAFVIRGRSCRPLGRAVVIGVRGQWASGYRGYLDGKLAPTNLNVIIQHVVAVRWNGTRMRELGTGDALAVNSNGLAVGATAIPGRTETTTTNFFSADGKGHTYTSAVPHAVAWTTDGRRVSIGDGSLRGVAYAVSNDGTVAGMQVARDGRHFAFRWSGGTLWRLDDLPHPPGWRFESAYAITRDGSIVGIGTLHGIPTVFRWHA